MRHSKKTCVLLAVTIAVGCVPACFALDQIGLAGEFSLPAQSHTLVDTQDDYYDAVQRLHNADADVVRAREAAMKNQQSSPEYLAAVQAVDQTYQAFREKKNGILDDLEKKNPIYTQMKSQATAIDSQIETARQNPATTQDQFEELYKNRETFLRQWQQLEGDAMDRAGATPLKQQWLDASKKLADLQDKQRVDVENTDKLKAAIANADEARTGVQQARAAISGTTVSPQLNNGEQASAEDFVCRNSGNGFTGNDAWWTYGWNTLTTAKPAGAVPTSGK
jgi:hypothetical protein